MPCANDQLSDEQRRVMEAIVDFGRQNGFSDDDIELIVQVAFQESSLGRQLANSGSSARGLFQYTEGTWNDRHSDLGDRSNNGNQVIAIFRDLLTLRDMFYDEFRNGTVSSDMTFDEYFYVRHHDGWYLSDLDNAPGSQLYDGFLNFCLDSIPPPPMPGTGGGYTDPNYFDGGDDYSWLDGWIFDHNLDGTRRVPDIIVGDVMPEVSGATATGHPGSDWLV